jgi:hypothetical protein
MGLRRPLDTARRWWKKDKPAAPWPRRRVRPELQRLEDRVTPTVNLWVDFGFNFPGGVLSVTDSQMQDKAVNGPSSPPGGGSLFGNGYSLISLTQTVINRNLDFDGDGVADATDARLLAHQVLSDVRRAYEPFGVNVLEIDSTGINGVKNALAFGDGNDAYIFADGATPSSLTSASGTVTGYAPVDTGNTQDNTGFAFADTVASLANGTLAGDALAIATNVAHEAGHTFGLKHTDPAQLVAAGDTMLTSSAQNTPFKFYRFNTPLDPTQNPPGSTQNDYAVLAANVGLGATGAGYVTGTGANDQIFLQDGGGGTVNVTVNAYSDNAYTNFLGSISYTIPAGVTQITVEAGLGNDDVVIDGNIQGISLVVRGGGGTDKVEVNTPGGASSFLVDGNNLFRTDPGSNFPLVSYDDQGETGSLQINGNPDTTVVVQDTAAATPPITTSGVGHVVIGPQYFAGQKVLSPVTVLDATDVKVGGGRADLVSGPVTIHSPDVQTALTVDDSRNPGASFFAASASSVMFDGHTLAYDAGRLSSLHLVGAAGGGSFFLGDSVTPLDTLPRDITVSGGGGFSALTVDGSDANANDFRVFRNSVAVYRDSRSGLHFLHHLTNRIHYDHLADLYVHGNLANGNDFSVYSTAAATPVSLFGGRVADNFFVGNSNYPLNGVAGPVTINGLGGGDQLYVYDTASDPVLTLSSAFTVTAGSVANQTTSFFHDRLGRHHVSNTLINYTNVGSVRVVGGAASTSFLVKSTAAGTPVYLTAGAGSVSSFQVGDAADSLDGLMAPVTLNGTGSSNLILDDEATAAARDENLDTGSLTRSTTDGVEPFTPVYFQGMSHITLDGSGGGSSAAVLGVAAGTTVDVYGHPGVSDVFSVYPQISTQDTQFGDAHIHGQLADNDFAYYFDYFAPGPNAYTFATDSTGTQEVVTRPGAGSATFDGVTEIIPATPQVGHSTVNVQGVVSTTFLNMALENGDAVAIGSQAPALGGTLAGINGAVSVGASAGAAVSLTVDDSGDTATGNKEVTLTPKQGVYDIGNHIDGFAPAEIFFNLDPSSSVTLLGGAANTLFVVRGTLDPVHLTIQGGSGDNILIAGDNAATLVDGGGQDILIAGTTDYDNNDAALMAILTEWSNPNEDFATKVSNLTTGANGLPALNSNTVHWNGGGSQLVGNADGLDWFFANSFGEITNFNNADIFTQIV